MFSRYRFHLMTMLALLLAGAARANILHVPSEYPTIQGGISAAVAGDSVLVAPGTYTNCDGGPCTASVAVMKNGVSLVSEGGPDLTTLRVDTGAGGLSVVFGQNITRPALLQGFTITATAPAYRGAGFLSCWGVVVQQCRFEDLDPGVDDGGGLKINVGNITLRGCGFLRCSANLGGAGLRSIDATATVDECLFEQCDAGGARFDGYGPNVVTVHNCTFVNNTGDAALIVVTVPQATVSGNVFQGNSSPKNATAFVVNDGSENVGYMVLDDNLFVLNDASQVGTVISWNSSGEVLGNTFWANQSKPGWAALWDGAPIVDSRTIANNIFVENSGGVACKAQNGPPQASCNLFWSNPGGDYAGYYQPSPTDLFVDPLLCDPEGGDFYLREGSPCLPDSSGTCGQIGAFGEGCQAVPVRGPFDTESWGWIKDGFR